MRNFYSSVWSVLLALASTNAAALVDLDHVESVSAGPGYYCALTDSGGVKCWGNNANGRLGDGTTSDRALATRIPSLTSGVAAVSTGYNHACALTSGGGVKCWGRNDSGQLGNGTTTQSSTPVDVTGLTSGVAAISAGGSHTCAVTTGGALKCWGANALGQLGDNSTTQRTEPVDVTGLGSGVATVSATKQHTCALTTAGGMLCWGDNESGQLGDGTTTQRSVPGDVTGLTSGVASISTGRGSNTGYYFDSPPGAGGLTCAVMLTGAAKCWGNEKTGELGNGSTTGDQVLPVDVQGLTAGVVKITIGSEIACSYIPQGAGVSTTHNSTHVCALMNGGGVKCWGGNTYAELGSTLPEVYSGQCHPMTFVPGFSPVGQSDVPVDATVLGGPVTDVGAGQGNNCVVDPAGKVKCWGFAVRPDGMGGVDATPVFVQTTDSGLTPQVITFGPKPTVPAGGTGTLTATGGNSTSPVVFTSLTPDVCTVSGSTVSWVADGICTVAADQAGDANYDPAPRVTLTFLVGNKLPQTVTFGPPPPLVASSYGVVTARASSGLPVVFGTLTGNCVFQPGNRGILAALQSGVCTVAAVQQGNEFYAPSPQVTMDITVGAAGGATTDLSITQVRETASPGVGRDIVYTITVQNSGPAISSATVVDALPDGVSLIWSYPSCGESSGLVTCTFADLGVGATVQAKIVLRPSVPGLLDHRVVVVGSVPEHSEPANNHSTNSTSVPALPAGVPVQRYRLYSDQSKEHLFTTDLNEYNVLGASGAWVQEGTVGKVLNNPGSFNGVVATPYYRLYDTSTAWHHWTTDPNEYYTLDLYSNWNGEGVDGYILPTNTAGATELFRLNYPAIPGLHHWTIDPVEYNQLITVYGWVGEGGSGFVVQ